MLPLPRERGERMPYWDRFLGKDHRNRKGISFRSPAAVGLGLSVLLQAGCAGGLRPLDYPFPPVARQSEERIDLLGAEARTGTQDIGLAKQVVIRQTQLSGSAPADTEATQDQTRDTLPSPRPGEQPPREASPALRAGEPLGPHRETRVDHHLSLDEVINAVLINDPRLMAGFQAVNQANANALTASLVPNPTVLADVLMLPLTRPFIPTKTGGPPQQDVMVSYPIDWYVFGKRAAEMASAGGSVKISEAEFANLVRQRVTEAALAYYDVVETRALLELAKQNIEVLARVEEVIARAVQLGGRPKVDLSRIKLDMLQNRQTMRDAETALVSAKARLRALIGRQDRDPDFDVSGTLSLQLAPDTPQPESAFDLAVENRPDVLAMRLRTVLAESNVTVEERKKYPDLVPMLGWTRQYQVAAMGMPDASSWNASVTTSLPLFNRNQGNRARAASQSLQAKIDYEASLVALRAEIETSAQELKAAKNNAEAAATEQIQLANDVLVSITTAYEAGGRPLVDMLDAQRNFRETNRSFISTRAAYWRALYRYWSAIGKRIHET